jgi:hypothetical protein
MEYILESIMNGQRKQALEQLMDSDYLLEDLFEKLLSQNMPNEIITMYRVAVRVGYIKFGDIK